MPDNQPEKPLSDIDQTVLAHLYRGETGRIMMWRQRMDVSTNWAVGITSALITSAYAQPATGHFVFILAYFILFLLLTIEARRFRYYHAYLYRVRLLEKHFIRPALTSAAAPSPDDASWRETIADDLSHPTFKMSKCHTLFSRFRKTYYWLYLLLTFSWLFKVGQECHEHTVRCFAKTLLLNQPFPEPLTVCLILIAFSGLLWLFIGGFFLVPYSEEFSEPESYPHNGVL